MSEATEKKKRGRPSLGKRGTFAFRVTDHMRERLEADSAASGRPVSEEIEMRLEASYQQPSPHSVGLVAMMAASIAVVENIAGRKWTEDDVVAEEARAAIIEVLDKYMSNPSLKDPKKRIADALLGRGEMGRNLAKAFIAGDDIFKAIGVAPPKVSDLALAEAMSGGRLRSGALKGGLFGLAGSLTEKNPTDFDKKDEPSDDT